jgi:hypothetical protein
MYMTRLDEYCRRPDSASVEPACPVHRTPAGRDRIDEAIEHLRSLAREGRCGTERDRHAMIEAWIAVEAHLADDEHDDLFDRLVDRVYPKSPA